MERKVAYPVLESKIAERGIRKASIADALGMNVRTLYNKLSGVKQFTWAEVIAIQKNFFPDVSKDMLMQTNADRTA